MTHNIQAPAKGEPLRASWAADVTRVLNAFPDKVGAAFRNERDRVSQVTSGCWTIANTTRTENEGEENETTASVRTFANQFYLDGEVLRELGLEDAVEDFVCQGELAVGEEYTAADKPFVCLKIPATTAGGAASLVGFATLEDLQQAQMAVAYGLKPLYKFTHGGSVAIDFRNCPAFQLAERLQA